MVQGVGVDEDAPRGGGVRSRAGVPAAHDVAEDVDLDEDAPRCPSRDAMYRRFPLASGNRLHDRVVRPEVPDDLTRRIHRDQQAETRGRCRPRRPSGRRSGASTPAPSAPAGSRWSRAGGKSSGSGSVSTISGRRRGPALPAASVAMNVTLLCVRPGRRPTSGTTCSVPGARSRDHEPIGHASSTAISTDSRAGSSVLTSTATPSGASGRAGSATFSRGDGRSRPVARRRAPCRGRRARTHGEGAAKRIAPRRMAVANSSMARSGAQAPLPPLGNRVLGAGAAHDVQQAVVALVAGVLEHRPGRDASRRVVRWSSGPARSTAG